MRLLFMRVDPGSLFLVLCWPHRGLAILAAWRELLDLNSNWQLELPLALSGLMKDF